MKIFNHINKSLEIYQSTIKIIHETLENRSGVALCFFFLKNIIKPKKMLILTNVEEYIRHHFGSNKSNK